MFRKPYFLKGLVVFFLLHITYFLILLFSYQTVPLNKYLYSSGFHYIEDTRVTYHQFSFLNALSAWDGQWYYRIAHAGYTTKIETSAHAGHVFLDQYAYAFLPLYPYTVAFFDILIQNTLLSFFIVSNLILIALFFTTYYVVSKLYSSKIAMRTSFLLLFFPLGLFYRTYYSEGLFLLLLLWFSYVLIKRNWWQVCISLALLYLTKVNGLFLLIPLSYVLLKEVKDKKLSKIKALAIIIAPFISLTFLYFIGVLNMNYGFIWIYAHNFWGPKVSVIQNVFNNIQTIFNFVQLPFHDYKPSKTEILAFIAGIILLIKSKKVLRPELWWIAFALCVTPLFLKNFTSYARYEIVIFPFFIYLAKRLHGIWYYATVALFFTGLVWFSIIFLNWGWIE